MPNLYQMLEETSATLDAGKVNLKFVDRGKIEGRSIMPAAAIKGKGKKHTLIIDSSSVDLYSKNEIKGFLATSLSLINIEKNGYLKNIQSGIIKTMHEFPASIDFLETVLERLKISSKDQIAVEKGLLKEVFDYRLRVVKECEKYFKKRDYKDNSETQINNVVGFALSVPFYATNNINYGKQIDEYSEKIFREISPDFKISKYGKLRDLLTIRNPPSVEQVNNNTYQISKMFFGMLAEA